MTAFSNLSLGSVPNDGTGSTLRTGGALINANMALAANKTEDNTFTSDNTFSGMINVGAEVDLTIASGIITASKSLHSIAGEGALADDLVTINGGTEGDLLIIKSQTSAYAITAKDGTGNLRLSADRVLDHIGDRLTLLYDGTSWYELAFSSNA